MNLLLKTQRMFMNHCNVLHWHDMCGSIHGAYDEP